MSSQVVDLPNVLILEDEELMSALLLKYLHGIQGNLGESLAIRQLSSGWGLLNEDLSGIRVAVVDILLPNVTGVDLIRDFRKRFPGMGIVPVSGLATEPMKRALKELLPSPSRLLAKPLRKEEFLDAFVEAWKMSQPLQPGPAPLLEADAEPVWSAVQSSNHKQEISVVRRRLGRPKKVA
jgi:DNA-binding NtrC family response regulator